MVPSEALQTIYRLLQRRTGHDFSGYRGSTITRRLMRRISLHQSKNVEHYIGFLQEHPDELDLLCQEFLIGVTSFFRDPEAFAVLEHEVFPQLLAAKADDEALRVWVPGCSTGEEVYSLALLLYECRERLGKQCKVQIFASDLDFQALQTARLGRYPAGISVDIRPDRLARFFSREEHTYRVGTELRAMVIFAQHNLLSDPPFTKLDLLSCRNLLIYLETALQQRLLPRLHYALQPHGWLLLGPSETVGAPSDLFTVIDKHWKVYHAQDIPTSPLVLAGPVTTLTERARHAPLPSMLPQRPPVPAVAALLDKLLVVRYAPPSVLVNDRGDIVHIHGRTGAYLEPAAGQPRLNILSMAREGLRLPLSAALSQAATHTDEIVQEVQVLTDGDSVRITLVVQQIVATETLRGLFLVSFQPASDVVPVPLASPPRRTRATPSGPMIIVKLELMKTREAWHKSVEELHAAHEEFTTAHEEMQATNEELQSSNEELETTQEELQSLNEELQTVNAELQQKVEALSDAQDDMSNLLHSTDIAAIFLDNDLRIRWFTDRARQLVPLIATDIWRPLSDIVSNLEYDNLLIDAQEVLRTLGTKERQVRTTTGTWYLMHIRPYRTIRNVISGAVLTFVDISQLKHAELLAEAAHTYAESIVQTVRDALLVLDMQLRVVSANQAFYQLFQESPARVEQHYIYDLGNGQWHSPPLRELLEDILPRNEWFDGFVVTHDFPHIGRRTMRLNARRLERASGLPGMILLAIEDVTAHSVQDKTGHQKGAQETT